MTSVAIEVPKAAGAQRQASLKRNRRWALITSYVFLVIFAIFFLMPPYYMIVTALKSDAEVAHMATNPWIIANGITLDQFKILFTQTDFLIFFKNTAIVTVAVVIITMVVSVSGGILSWPHAILGVKHTRDGHLPDLPRARHIALHSPVPDREGHWPAQFVLGNGCGLSDPYGAVLHLDHDRILPIHSEGA